MDRILRGIVIGVAAAAAALFLASGGLVAFAKSAQAPTAEAARESAAIAGASGTTFATATAVSSRLLVVDEDEEVLEVWSNATGPEYRLTVRLGSRSGPEYPLTDTVARRYDTLIDKLDWSRRGLVAEFGKTEAVD